MNKHISTDLIIHPGESLTDILKLRNITPAELAKKHNLDFSTLIDVLSGCADISADFAVSLEHALDIPRSFWLNLQTRYYVERLEASLNLLIREYLSKCQEYGCDSCIAEYYCIENNLKTDRYPQKDCPEKIETYLFDYRFKSTIGSAEEVDTEKTAHRGKAEWQPYTNPNDDTDIAVCCSSCHRINDFPSTYCPFCGRYMNV